MTLSLQPARCELAHPNLRGVASFYHEVLGWDLHAPPQESRWVFLQEGEPVAFAYLIPEGVQAPAHWLPVFETRRGPLVNDSEAGHSQILVSDAAADTHTLERDEGGAVFGTVQGPAGIPIHTARHRGVVQLEYVTTAPVRGARFYERRLGWSAEPLHAHGGAVSMNQDDTCVALITPAEVPYLYEPPYWLTYMAVPSCKTAAEAVEREGGWVVQPPKPQPNGSICAVVSDPGGAVFALLEGPPRVQIGARSQSA